MTCGLQNSESPTSDNLTSQETTAHDTGTVGADGASLSCPGSNVVADRDGESEKLENPSATETIEHYPPQSVPSQSLTEKSEAGEEPTKHDRTR